MPPKRANPSTSTQSGGVSKKAKATTKSKKTAPKLPRSTPPNWQNRNPEWSKDMPKGKNAKKCIERWCLLPPYDHSITEKQWKAYHDERAALDRDNTWGYYAKPSIENDYLRSPWPILKISSRNIASAIYGSVLDEEEKTAIARTIRGSLYFLELEGRDGGDGPRSVHAKTRLYSPFGIGTSVDLAYDYHFRYREGEQFGSLVAVSNDVDDLSPGNPRKSRVTKGSWSVKIFSWNGTNKITATTAKMINSFEPTLFGSTGWLSPLKLHNILFAAGTGLTYGEDHYSTDPEIASQEKFTFFEGETTGGHLSEMEDELFEELDEQAPGEDLGDVYLPEGEKAGCVPRRLLLLARQE
ncbi:unnamed protein product [Rhizoctonia solani]|uniref:Uncharacterized protein n=1 Tax=Rhizoctonia solani TaxID=456999 RepID=A0A8H3E1C3_9AGAM|nr:unnamed protein product [Rhizoctonia solani]